jgi:hypothetical protein
MNVAQYVNDQLQYLDEGSPLTMTISREKSGELCVTIATGSLSDDTALQTAKFFSETQVNT